MLVAYDFQEKNQPQNRHKCGTTVEKNVLPELQKEKCEIKEDKKEVKKGAKK